ncbi:hypothetical protein ABB37_04438 [Leptomonas pyrrhocoris]|uniref:Uncharacterized protein n=1 Tax=Leptomonas pyrrhocoris TaxID=157538 RepID=A0A0M9G2X7_LEPPY|nr:hypothetical protein ABB37_04438 [Leptomonas pyrrhocoris]KPA81079.1 hypothetical protein ABB37_04438 [Leptomonas pyrrhocoris]|eukprot:XP_015659518.1 hypothetical protein ABB37_04438 [Leptomonas pyrrhocoris]
MCSLSGHFTSEYMRPTRACQRAVTPSVSQRSATPFTVGASRLAALSASHNASTNSGVIRCYRSAHASCFFLLTSTLPPSLQCSRASIKSRSLSPDDPFGEKSSWEDPSDGLFSAWKDADQEGFVNATQSASVRHAHFGPEWARFTTVGRLSVKKMKEEQAVQPHQLPSSAAETEGDAEGTAGTTATTAPKRYPSAEELHEAELKAKRRLLERNYMSYEAFVEHELGAGEGFSENTVSETIDGAGAGAELYSAASMESAFSAVEGVDGRDRMAQRNIEREALDTIEAAEVEETVPLPNFMFDADTRRGSPAAGAVENETASAFELGNEDSVLEKHNAKEIDDMPATASVPPFATQTGSSPTSVARPSQSTATPSSTIPTSVVHQVLRALGAPHGDAQIPLTDPMHWETEDIIFFISAMERRPADVDAETPRDAWTTMDNTMSDAFRMAKTTGDTLLNVVVPPRLFRVMRRWHVRRQDVVNKAWRHYHETLASAMPSAGSTAQSSASNDGVFELPQAIVVAAVEESCAKLDEAVQPLDRILIQETILLCFPYGH